MLLPQQERGKEQGAPMHPNGCSNKATNSPILVFPPPIDAVMMKWLPLRKMGVGAVAKFSSELGNHCKPHWTGKSTQACTGKINMGLGLGKRFRFDSCHHHQPPLPRSIHSLPSPTSSATFTSTCDFVRLLQSVGEKLPMAPQQRISSHTARATRCSACTHTRTHTKCPLPLSYGK